MAHHPKTSINLKQWNLDFLNFPKFNRIYNNENTNYPLITFQLIVSYEFIQAFCCCMVHFQKLYVYYEFHFTLYVLEHLKRICIQLWV